MHKICNTVVSSKQNGNKIDNDDKKQHEVFVVNDSWTARDVAKYIADNTKESIEENRTFTVLNIKDLIEQVNKWKKWMPRIRPYYAVKCNNNGIVLEVLAGLGLNFDCASLKEIQEVLSAGVEPQRIIFAHTYKPESSLKYAKENNVDLLTFDSDIELMKIARHHPSARLLIRIANDDETAVCRLGNKFGCCPQTEAPVLLQIAKELQLNVVGVCFHVGSLSKDTSAYITGIRMAKELFHIGSALGYDMKIVNIGGGFLGDSDTIMELAAVEINSVLDECFPRGDKYEIIAEPGRFFVSSAVTLACLVHSAKRPITMVKGLDNNNLYNMSNIHKTNIGVNGHSNKENNGIASNGLCNDQGNGFTEHFDEMQKTVDDHFKKAHDHLSSNGIMYILDNGVYGSFLGVLWKRLNIKPEPLYSLAGPEIECSLWGPTCDGKDMICPQVFLPPLPVPSWLIFHHFGAYTCTTCTSFNGFAKPLQYTFLPKSLEICLKELPHIKSRNKIKWSELTRHLPSTLQENEIPTNLPIEKLLCYRAMA